MSVEENIEIMRKWFDAVWTRGDYDYVRQVLAPDGRGHGQSERQEPIVGPEEFIAFAKRIRGAFPDMVTQIEDIFGTSDRVVVRWTAQMTHSGHDLGIPATGKKVTTNGISIVQFREGKLIAGWDCWDQAGLFRQLSEPEQRAGAA